jgi:hypothetical protein
LKDPPSKAPAKSESTGTRDSANRRRIGRVVHDDRGSASLEWREAPVTQRRTVLELEDTIRAQRRLQSLNENPATKALRQDKFNPYQRASGTAPASGPRRDLRKLSEWIKTMREIEERKARERQEANKPVEE